MTIQDGFGGKKFKISISPREGRKAEVWTYIAGLPDDGVANKYRELLHYATLDELLQLQDNIKSVIQELVS